ADDRPRVAFHVRRSRFAPCGTSLQPTKKPHEEAFLHQERSGSGGRIRTCDLRVMSPTSCQTAPPRIRVRKVYRDGGFLASTKIVALAGKPSADMGVRRRTRAGTMPAAAPSTGRAQAAPRHSPTAPRAARCRS